MKSRLNQQYICVELTQNCNNACHHCYNFWRQDGNVLFDSRKQTLSRETITSIIQKIKKDAPIEYVALSGGEPFLRLDLPEIIGDIINIGLKPVIITNGTLITERILKRLPSGINFEITLFDYIAPIHNRLAGRDVFDNILKNIILLEKYHLFFTLVFVATKLNALDVSRTVELGLALGAGAIMYNRVNISKGIKKYVDELVPSRELLSESLHMFQDIIRKYKITSVCSVPIPPCVIDISKYPDLNFGWCPRGGEDAYYTIGCDGMLRPCNHSSLVLGDIRREGFAEIIARKKCQSFWQRIPDECHICDHPLKNHCRGGCTAAAAEYYGSQYRVDPIVELMGKRTN